MGEHAFITHRNYIGDLEQWLAIHGGSEFTPLPSWNPPNPIPPEFNVVKPQDNGTARPPLVNLTPNLGKPAGLVPPALCGIADADALWDNNVDGWHGAVHVTIGGTMGDIHIAPAAPVFFCWHGYVDEIYEDWLRCRWSGWEDWGGVLTSGVGAAAWAANRLDCFVKGQNNHMWHKWWNGNAWSGWEDLGGIIDGSPSAVSWGPNRIDCFARGMNSAMWHRWWALVPTVRLHFKILGNPTSFTVNQMLASMQTVYNANGFAVQLGSTENLNLPLLNDLDVGPCTMGTTTAEQNQLFGNRNNVGPNDVACYFVRSTVP